MGGSGQTGGEHSYAGRSAVEQAGALPCHIKRSSRVEVRAKSQKCQGNCDSLSYCCCL